MKKIIYVLMFICLSFSLFACSGSSYNPVQQGWDKYAGSIKSTLEQNLTLEYVWLQDESLSSGECVYYKGYYGHYTDPNRVESTTFYFLYDVENDSVESATKYMYELAVSLSYSSKSKTGTLISN